MGIYEPSELTRIAFNMFKQKNKNKTISEDSPLVAGKLIVYPERLQFKDVRCSFYDIEHIGWYWITHNQSGLKTHNSTLTLYIRGRREPIRIKGSSTFSAPPLVQAYSYISQKTFARRAQFYMAQLDEVGGFTYDRAYFYTDGRVVRNGKTFDLAKASVQPFSLTMKQDGFFAPRLTVSLDIDKDVVLSLIDFILKNPQKPEDYASGAQRKQQSTTPNFIRYTVSMMAKLAKADGVVSREELVHIYGIFENTFSLEGEEIDAAIEIFKEAKSNATSFEYYAERLFEEYGENKDLLTVILDMFFNIAIADGTFSAEEELLILEAEAVFGVSAKRYREFKSSSRKTKSNRREECLEILGVSIQATDTEIKKQYKRLVMKYHPDRMHHLGEEFVKEAEEKMKQINEAYDYLTK